MNTTQDAQAGSLKRSVRMPNWWHWQIYKLFRWAWNPTLANNRPMRQGLGKALLEWKEDDAGHPNVSDQATASEELPKT